MANLTKRRNPRTCYSTVTCKTIAILFNIITTALLLIVLLGPGRCPCARHCATITQWSIFYMRIYSMNINTFQYRSIHFSDFFAISKISSFLVLRDNSLVLQSYNLFKSSLVYFVLTLIAFIKIGLQFMKGHRPWWPSGLRRYLKFK